MALQSLDCESASVRQASNFEFLQGRHLGRPDLDVDLALESLKSPSAFPLIAK